MKGARKYARLFETGQYGRLYLVSGSHARGSTFHIYVLPEGEKAIPNGSINAPLNKDAVEVYGITAGQPGWTEEYGWLHEGKWKEDFEHLVEKRETEMRQLEDETLRKVSEARAEEEKRAKALLGAYR